MKKCVFLLLLIVTIKLQAQNDFIENRSDYDNRLFHMGYVLGLSNFNFAIDPTSTYGTNGENLVQSTPELGFHVGLIGGMRINELVTLRVEPTAYFSQRTLTFTHLNNETRLIKSNYIDLPLLVKFNSRRYQNVRPYISGGASIMVNMSSNEDKKEDNFQGVYRTKRLNYTWQAEFGVEINAKYFKLTPAIKGIFMLNNESIADDTSPSPYTGAVNALRSRAVVFSLKFE